MIKFLFVARRAPGQTRKGALDHLRDIHAKMVVCAPADAGPMPLDYVQNHVIDGAYFGTGDHGLERDLVTELWFDSLDHLRASTATPYYLETLRPDEPRFVDEATVAKLMVRPRVLAGAGTGRFKTFIFLPDGADDTLNAAFVASPGLIAAVANAVLPPPTGAPPFAGSVLEGWFETADAATATLHAMRARLAAPEADGIDRGRAFALVAEQYDTVRLRALHGCTAASEGSPT